MFPVFFLRSDSLRLKKADGYTGTNNMGYFLTKGDSMDSAKTELGLFDTLKQRLNPTAVMKKLNLTQEKLIDMALYLGIGFLVGFLIKKYDKFIFVAVLLIVGLILAQQAGLVSITVYWYKIQEFLGARPLEPIEGSFFSAYWEWAKANVILVASFSVGFLVGLRVG